MEFKRSDMDELSLLVTPAKKKCAGNRPPPCGRGENCKGFKEGHRCGGHAPAKNCARNGNAAASQQREAEFERELAENARAFQAGKFQRGAW